MFGHGFLRISPGWLHDRGPSLPDSIGKGAVQGHRTIVQFSVRYRSGSFNFAIEPVDLNGSAAYRVVSFLLFVKKLFIKFH